jgi:hypothetical protein
MDEITYGDFWNLIANFLYYSLLIALFVATISGTAVSVLYIWRRWMAPQIPGYP